MKTTAYVTHPDCSRHDTGWGHPEHQGRLPAVARAVYRDMLTLFEPLLEVEARPASAAQLALAHAPKYVEQVRIAAEAAERVRGVLPLTDRTVVSAASWDAARAASGAAITAVDAVLDGRVRNAFCAVRPPGQGAGVSHAGGFALFNHVAVAARHLRERRGLARVLIVESAARPGDGTAEFAAGDPGLLLLSAHQEEVGAGAWPERALRVGIPRGSGAAAMLGALAELLDGALEDFAPEFFLVSLGLDALAGDPLGALALRPEDYHPLTVMLRERAERHCAGRLVSVLEGGYRVPDIGAAVVQHLRALAGLPPACA